MWHFFKKGARFTLGILSIIFGIIGILLPILPGIPFLIIGAALISPEFEKKVQIYISQLKEKWNQYKKNRNR